MLKTCRRLAAIALAATFATACGGAGATRSALPTASAAPATPPTAALVDLRVIAKIPAANAFEITSAFGSVWVGGNEVGTVYRIATATNALVATIQVSGFTAGLVASDTAIWVVDGDSSSAREIDPKTNKLTERKVAIGDDGGDLQWRDGKLWHSYPDGRLRGFDPATGKATDLDLSDGACDDCGFAILGDEAYRITGDSISRVDMTTGKVLATNDSDTSGGLMSLGAAGLWIGGPNGSVSLLDPATLELRAAYTASPATAADGSSWSLGAAGGNGSIVADETGAWFRFSAPVLGHATAGGPGTVTLFGGPFPTGWTGSSAFIIADGSLWITNVSAGDVWRLELPRA